MNKRMWMVLTAICLLWAAPGASWARTYRIGVVPWVGWSPMHVAEAKGFFADRGVDVRVFTFPSIQALQGAFDNRLIDICFEMIGTAVGWRMEGRPLAIIAETNWSHGGDKIIVKAGVSMEALRNRPVGVYLDQPSVLFFLNQHLASAGLKLTDVRVMEMETAQLADKFIDGLFPMIVAYDPDALRAERQGNGTVATTSAACEGCIPEGMFALEEILAGIPRTDLVGILRGWIEAAEWVNDPANWDEYAAILNRETFKSDGPHPEEDLKSMFSAVRIHDAAAMLERNRDGGGLAIYMENLKAFLRENDLLKRDFDPKALFRNATIVEALSRN